MPFGVIRLRLEPKPIGQSLLSVEPSDGSGSHRPGGTKVRYALTFKPNQLTGVGQSMGHGVEMH